VLIQSKNLSHNNLSKSWKFFNRQQLTLQTVKPGSSV